MSPPRLPMTGVSPSANLLRPMACQPRIFICQKCPPDGSPSF
jgi:hypothetical protein